MPERCAGSHALPPPRPPLLAVAQWGGAGQALRQVREGGGGSFTTCLGRAGRDRQAAIAGVQLPC